MLHPLGGEAGRVREEVRLQGGGQLRSHAGRPTIEAIVNTTPNDVHLPTTKQAADAGKHVFLDKPIANNITEGRAITEICRKAGVVLGMGYQRRRRVTFAGSNADRRRRVRPLVNAEANISRDRLGQIDLSSWRYQAAGMPGGVMLQIGIHYADVLTYLMGPVGGARPVRAACASGR